ncbi:MAG TPA: SulP family inorganic anion transporter [Gemmatimonadales bacterium]|nr:SulP family inorganic anion transporter [Gemmatimonadales bacterium]
MEVRAASSHRRFPRPVRADLIAGLTVALVLIPQALAYAEIAGLPPRSGLMVAAAPAILAAVFASSPHLQTGPTAVSALLTFGALSSIAEPGSSEYIALAAMLALVSGVVLVLLNLVRAGVLSYVMSQPVLWGFTAAAALLIIISQVPDVAGVTELPEGRLLYQAGWVLVHPSSWDLTSILMGCGSIALVLGVRRINPRLPVVPLVVVVGVLWSRFGGFTGATVGDLPSGLPAFALTWPGEQFTTLILPAVVVALAGFLETSAIARSFATIDRMRWDPNRELLGQGLANVAAGLSGGFPVSASLSRSSLNRLTGSQTRWSGIITGIAVLAFLPVDGVLEPLPRPALAAVVVAAVTTLFRPDRILRVFRASLPQGIIGVATFGLTLALEPQIHQALVVGIIMGVLVHLARELRLDVATHYEAETLRFAPRGVLFFGSAHLLEDGLREAIADHPEAEKLNIDLAHVGRLDFTGAVVLEYLADRATQAGLEVELTNVPVAARRLIDGVWRPRVRSAITMQNLVDWLAPWARRPGRGRRPPPPD